MHIDPERLRWARRRAGLEVDALVKRFPKYLEWERGEVAPTYKQLEKLATATHAPLAAFFFSKPLDEEMDLPDLRTVGNRPLGSPSLNLRHTIYACELRQDWYRGYALSEGEQPLALVGSLTLDHDPVLAAARIRTTLGFDLNERHLLANWTEAMRRFAEQAEALGILVMISGIVGNNTTRKLDPSEFRGFALVDDVAPLVFVNGADSKAAQMFTLAHELAHIWLGESGVSAVDPVSLPSNSIEIWCNKVAAELLVPLASLREEFQEGFDLNEETSRLARHFKVSRLVVLRRIHDLGAIEPQAFRKAYWTEAKRLSKRPTGSGGDFYATLKVRVGQQFACALVADTLEGNTSFTDAFRLLGIKKLSTLDELAVRLNAVPE